jgi:hypothetical protein
MALAMMCGEVRALRELILSVRTGVALVRPANKHGHDPGAQGPPPPRPNLPVAWSNQRANFLATLQFRGDRAQE